MSTFSQWRTGFVKKPNARQFNYVCGNERVLVEDVVDSLLGEIAPDPWNLSVLIVGEDTERTIWNELSQFPIGPGKRVVVVRSAQRISSWERFMVFLRDRTSNPKTHVIFVSDEERLPRVENAEGKPEYPPHLAAFGTKGMLIECRPFTQETAKHAVAWVQDRLTIREGVAGYLLDRANGDLRLVRDLCDKLKLWPGEATMQTVNALMQQTPDETFIDALLAMDKKTALLALQQLPASDYSKTIGFLDARMDLAGMVHDMLAQMKNVGEITRAAGNKNWLVREVLPYAKHYDTKRRQSIRSLLATVDEAQRAGAVDGTMECLVALW